MSLPPAILQERLAAALAAHQQGRLDEAEAGYLTVLESDPEQADACHLLGLISLQRGRTEDAIARIEAAIRLRPHDPFFHNNLGEAYRALGRHPRARAAYETAVRLNPGYAIAWNNLGVVLEQQGDGAGARQAYQTALDLQPGYFEAQHNLGVLLHRLGDRGAAATALEGALRAAPQSARAHVSLAVVCYQDGRWDEALRHLARASELDPKLTEVDYHRAAVLQKLGRVAEAEEAYRRCVEAQPNVAAAYHGWGALLLKARQIDLALEKLQRAVNLDPNVSDAWSDLGAALITKMDYPAAESALEKAIQLGADNYRATSNLALLRRKQRRWAECFAATQRTLELRPDFVEAWVNYATALAETGRLLDALQAIDRALALDANFPAALLGKGNLLLEIGEADPSLAFYRAASEAEPANWAWSSNYLFALNYAARVTPNEVAEIHFAVGRRLQETVGAVPARRRVARAGRRMRIGFVSPDLKEHSVARFLEPLWRNYDHNRFEFVAYAELERPDQYTEVLKPLVDSWRETHGRSDAAVCRQIEEDQIDILFDLAGHTHRERLRVFASRPAPVQVTWLGYPATTGLRAMDYRLTDAWADPPGQTEQWHTERLIRLDGPAWCFQAPREAGPTTRAEPNDEEIVFCSFNQAAKYSERSIGLWSRVLQAVPRSRLLLKGKGLEDPGVVGRFVGRFQQCGVATERIEFRAPTQRAEDHFATYHLADIALDTFPYHGTTTTCEALWMGLPVVTRIGAAHVSRVGASLLHHIGLPELAARTDEEFVAIAAALARDPARLRELRATLRSRMQTSPLMNGADFARRFAHACEAMLHDQTRGVA